MKKFLSPLTITILAFVLVLTSPFLLTRNSLSSALDFTKTGEIGDTIGGLTGPIIGLLNAILLYITLKRQEEQNERQNQQIVKQEDQRNEDIFNIDFDRRLGVIRNKIDSIKLDVDYSNGITDVPFPYKGSYAGPEVLIIIPALFDDNNPILSNYKISIIQWSAVFYNINAVVIEAGMLVEKNYHSKILKSQKIINFEYLTYIIAEIKIIYDAMKNYQTQHPNDPGLAKLFINEIVDFKLQIDKFEELRP